jgi:hypothetical protein
VSELITRTARLIPYSKRPKQVPSFVTAYMYEPQADEPTAHLGNLYITIEVLVTGRASEEVADLVIEAFGDHYYNQAEFKSPLERFESAIKSTNHQLADFINQGNAAWIGKMSAIVAVVADSEIHLCQTGSADAYLYRGKAHTRIISPSNKPAQPSKTFSSIASGELDAGDKLLFTTPALVHQITMQRLHSIISSHSPNAAIAELTAHLPSTGSERIGVLIIELTTPELAALQIRSDEPNEIKIGQPENTYEAVKLAATPAAQSAIASGRKATAAASTHAESLKPHIRRICLAIIRFIREQLEGKRGGRRILGAAAVILLITVIALFQASSARQLKTLKLRYAKNYQLYLTAQTQAASNQKSEAATNLDSVKKDLTSLQKTSAHKRLDNALAHEALPENEPHSVTKFISVINDSIDKLNGLERLNGTTISNLQSTNSSHIEVYGANAYIFGTEGKNGINVVNITTKTATLSKAITSTIGQIASTTLSSSGDGIYILSKTPSVWFYRFDNDSITEITLGGSGWESGTAISSYNGNLYIISDGTIYKHIRTITGFSPKAPVVSKDNSPAIATAHGLAINGTIFTVSSSGLQAFLAGSELPLLKLPPDLTSQNPTMRGSDTILLITNPSTQRLGVISTKGVSPVLLNEIAISNVSDIKDAYYDESTKLVYVVAGQKLILLKPSV